jgi:hypothetical protein
MPETALLDAELERRGLPRLAFIDNRHGHYGPSPVIAVRRGERGYYPIQTTATAEALNERSGVTTEQVEAMHVGSMFGWDVPGAFPANQKRDA